MAPCYAILTSYGWRKRTWPSRTLSSQSRSAAQSQHRLVWRQPSLSLGAWQPALQRAPLRPCCASRLECAPACMMRKGAGRRHTRGRTHHRRAGRLLEVARLAVVAIRREDRGVLRCLRAHVTRLHVVRLAIVDAAAAVLEILCLREALLLRQSQNLQLSIRSEESGPGIEGT